MRGSERSVVGWIQLPLAAWLCIALSDRCAGQLPRPLDAEGTNWEKPPGTWLDPDWAAESECDLAGSGDTCWLARWLPHFSERHVGLGEPLMGTSWLNRPMYVGGFLGETFGGTLVSGEADLRSSLFGGVWLGYDFSHYWGSEIRVGLNYAEVEYLPERVTGPNSRNAVVDINLLYYPWGDSRWRPYTEIGLGIGGIHVDDSSDRTIDHTGFGLPLGLGVKYLWGKQCVLRLDVKDNLIFGGNGVDTINNWSVTGGFEFHWGHGSAAQYAPW